MASASRAGGCKSALQQPLHPNHLNPFRARTLIFPERALFKRRFDLNSLIHIVLPISSCHCPAGCKTYSICCVTFVWRKRPHLDVVTISLICINMEFKVAVLVAICILHSSHKPVLCVFLGSLSFILKGFLLTYCAKVMQERKSSAWGCTNGNHSFFLFCSIFFTSSISSLFLCSLLQSKATLAHLACKLKQI